MLSILTRIIPTQVDVVIPLHAIPGYHCRDLASTPVQSTSSVYLKHDLEAEQLVLPYNVVTNSLQPGLDDNPGDHWTLIIADICSGKIYIFGAESGLETEAQMVARNIATLINNYRLVLEEGQVQWIMPFYFTPVSH